MVSKFSVRRVVSPVAESWVPIALSRLLDVFPKGMVRYGYSEL